MNRREYLGAAGGIAAAVTAGCSGDSSADLELPERVLRRVEFERHEPAARLTLVDDPAAVDLRIDSGVTERTVSVRARDDRIFVPIDEDGGELLVEARTDEGVTTIHSEQYGRQRVVDGVYAGAQFDEFPATAEVAFTARDPESYGATLTALRAGEHNRFGSIATQVFARVGLASAYDEITLSVERGDGEAELHRERLYHGEA